MNALPVAARHVLEAMMTGYQFPQSDFWKRVLAEHTKEKEEARARGREEGLIHAIVAIARLRLGEALTDDDEASIGRVHGRDRLDALLAAIESTRDSTEVRALLDSLDPEH